MMNLTGKMQKVFRVSARGDNSTIGYALTPMGADALASIITSNGYTPIIQPMNLKEVSASELETLKALI